MKVSFGHFLMAEDNQIPLEIGETDEQEITPGK